MLNNYKYQKLNSEESAESREPSVTYIAEGKLPAYKMLEAINEERIVFVKVLDRIIFLDFNKRDALLDLCNLKVKVRKCGSQLYLQKNDLNDLLHILISKHTKISVNENVGKVISILLHDITSLVLEEVIIAKWWCAKKASYSIKNSNPICEEDIPDMRSEFGELERTKLLQLVEKRVSKWYKYLLSKKNLNIEKYLTYVRMQLSERAFSNGIFDKMFMRDLKVFLEKARFLEQFKKAPVKKENLFAKRNDATYNLDYILNLLVANRHSLEKYCQNSELQNTFPYSHKDIALIQALYEHRDLLSNLFDTLHCAMDGKKEYVDIEYLTDFSKQEQVRKVKNPTKVCVVEKLNFAYTLSEIDDTDLKAHAESYLQAREHLFHTFVKSHHCKKASQSFKGMLTQKTSILPFIALLSMAALCSTTSMIVASQR